MWIDSHCHINHARNAEGDSPEAIVSRAHKAGVEGLLTICCEIAGEFPSLLETVGTLRNVWCSVGTHPHDAGLESERAVTQEELVRLALSDPKVIAIGESGLDYYYDNSPREVQQESFRKHIRACIETGMPLVVHAREADEDIIQIIREENTAAGKNVRGVMHCFSSGPRMAEEALEEGFYISFSGIVTFKNSTGLQEIAKRVPPDRMLVETDAPFLAPVPYRGKINEPAYVAHTGSFLAGLLRIEEAALAKQTKDNFFRLFDRAGRTWTES
ncbi:MAG: TatD family hydrolase [Micavibrio sp.]